MNINYPHCKLIYVEYLPGLTPEENEEYRLYESLPFRTLVSSPNYARYRELRDKIITTMPVTPHD